jgi:hypothetical protein
MQLFPEEYFIQPSECLYVALVSAALKSGIVGVQNFKTFPRTLTLM